MKRSSAKKTPTKRSPGKKAGEPKYNYVELSKASLASTDLNNFYGVIVDATFPYKVNANRFICSLKVIDPSLNTNKFASVVIYANRFEDLPIVHRLGEVIRVHRAGLRIYNGNRQFNVNV